MTSIPIIVLKYNSSGQHIVDSIVMQPVMDSTAAKLKGLTIRSICREKGVIMFFISRSDVDFPEPLGVEEFFMASRGDSIPLVIEKLFTKFKTMLPYNLVKAKECFGIDALNFKKGN